MVALCDAYPCRSCGSGLRRGDFLLCAPCSRDLIGAVVAQQIVQQVTEEIDAEDERLYGSADA